ncbi:metalloreductase STEAP2 isoform X2 [Synchiropus splendidus]|uniref:metalloreductase STEAP2 isoform X2 n=1 Tax=Synchiropus splendidus TaxID=270530 RepID=UPI00237EE5A5|nr:metalloreductase STEAP2 isoform X2 [Synchiropus splendidus]
MPDRRSRNICPWTQFTDPLDPPHEHRQRRITSTHLHQPQETPEEASPGKMDSQRGGRCSPLFLTASSSSHPHHHHPCFLANGISNGAADIGATCLPATCLPAQPTVAILGSGDFSKCLTFRLLRGGFHVVVGSRHPKRAAQSFPHVVDVTHHEDAVGKADVVFLAIRREHYSILWDLKHLMEGKILVDVSNNRRVNQYPESNAEYLASLLPDSIVVKGFNVIPAWTMQQTSPQDASTQVFICSDSVLARQQIMELARQLTFQPVDMGPLSSSRDIENMPIQLFPGWKGPVLTAVALSIFFFAYSFIRDIIHPYVKYKQSDFYKIPIEMVNRTLPTVAITLLALVYLAGQLASVHQLYYGTKYRRFPHWLEGWLQSRKQLGLLSFFLAAVHVLYSLCLPMRRSERYLLLNTAYQQVHAHVENVWNEEEVWRVEMYVSFGVMSLGLLSLLAVTSIPSVQRTLNWREFSFIQSTLGYIALLIATLHGLLFGWKQAFEEEAYRFYLPPNFVVALFLPSCVILGKVLTLLPCVASKLHRIRRGLDSRQCRRKEQASSGFHVSPERVTIM